MRPFFVWPLAALGISIIIGCGGSSSEPVSPASSGQEQSGDAQSKITESSGLKDPSETKAQQARNAVAAGAQTGDEKNYAEAIRYYTEAIGQSPDDAELYQERGMIHALLEQHESAIKDLTQAIDRNRTEASLYRWRAEEYFESGDFDSAERDIENAIALKPDNSEFYVVRASLRAELGRVDEALADYQHAIELDDRAFHYYLRGTLQAALDSPEAALEDLTTAITKEPDQADYYLARANVQISLGQPELALADYGMAVECDPENANTLQRRAGFLLSQGDNDAAIADLTAALEREPGLLTARRLRGIAYRMAEQYTNAVADFQMVLDAGLEDDSMRAELLYQQGVALQEEVNHEEEGNHKEAIEKLKLATSLKKDFAEAYFAISMSYAELSSTDPTKVDDAKSFLNRAIETDPKSSEYLLARAGLYQAEAEIQKILEEGNPAEMIKLAHADIQRATEANPNDDSAWYSLALISTSDGDDQKALQCLTRAIELNPGDDRYFEARADIQLRRQNFLAAIDDYTKALEQNPDRPDLYQARGYAYGEIGRSEDAANDFDKADRLTPPATESSSETDDEQNPETPDPGSPE